MTSKSNSAPILDASTQHGHDGAHGSGGLTLKCIVHVRTHRGAVRDRGLFVGHGAPLYLEPALRAVLRALKDIADHRDPADSTEKSESAEPIENAEAMEPIEPIDSVDPIEPIERNDPRHPIDKKESSDHSDQREPGE
jgi:hypothetical protein